MNEKPDDVNGFILDFLLSNREKLKAGETCYSLSKSVDKAWFKSHLDKPAKNIMCAMLKDLPEEPIDFMINLLSKKKPKVIFVMGGPGAGKGT